MRSLSTLLVLVITLTTLFAPVASVVGAKDPEKGFSGITSVVEDGGAKTPENGANDNEDDILVLIKDEDEVGPWDGLPTDPLVLDNDAADLDGEGVDGKPLAPPTGGGEVQCSVYVVSTPHPRACPV